MVSEGDEKLLGRKAGDYERYVPESGGPYRNKNVLERWNDKIFNFFDKPTTWFRETIVVPNRKQYNWYHKQFRRVPTIDQCYTDDHVCIYEANAQFKRDRLVDNNIVQILRNRMDDCVREEYPDHARICFKLKEEYLKATENWFSRYGDLGGDLDVRKAYMKQKHRMIWERRHGPIGTGMRRNDFEA